MPRPARRPFERGARLPGRAWTARGRRPADTCVARTAGGARGMGSGGRTQPELIRPGPWCTRCGARQGIAGPEWICRVCVAGGLHKRIVHNPGRCPLPAGTPRARTRYRAAGLCVQCGRRRDRSDRLACVRCRRRLAARSDPLPLGASSRSSVRLRGRPRSAPAAHLGGPVRRVRRRT